MMGNTTKSASLKSRQFKFDSRKVALRSRKGRRGTTGATKSSGLSSISLLPQFALCFLISWMIISFSFILLYRNNELFFNDSNASKENERTSDSKETDDNTIIVNNNNNNVVDENSKNDPTTDDTSILFDTAHIFSGQTRQQQRTVRQMHETFKQLRNENKLHECRLDGDCHVPTHNTFSFTNILGKSSSSSSSSSTKNYILLHNRLPQPRYYCGRKIHGNGGTLQLEVPIKNCSIPFPYMFAGKPPPIDGKGMVPIDLFWNVDNEDDDFYVNDRPYDMTPFPSCSVPCRTNGEFQLVSTISIKDTRWKVIMSMEGDEYYSKIKVRQKAYRKDKYYATTSFKSEIPVPYFSWTEYNINHQAVNFDTSIKGASYLAANCDTMSHREDYVEALMKKTDLRVDSLSECLHNAAPPPNVNMENKTAILERYLFHLAFENQRSDDYITEKLWGTLASGTLPIYFGAPNIKEHVPPHSTIFVDDFDSPDELADYLIRLSNDKALYNSYHQWRYKPIDDKFINKYAFTETHSTCRICSWAYAKKHGLGWNHTSQQIQQPYIARKTCRNQIGLIGHPFKEYWLHTNDNESRRGVGGSEPIKIAASTATPVTHISSNGHVKTCMINGENRVLLIDDGEVERRVYDHDGVTDLIIDRTKSKKNGRSYILKLETPIISKELHSIDGTDNREWWLQDKESRMTLLTSQQLDNKDDDIQVVESGVIQIVIPSSSSSSSSSVLRWQQQQQHDNDNNLFKIRIFMENVDTFHINAKKRPNYYGTMMKKDFFYPIESYKIIS